MNTKYQIAIREPLRELLVKIPQRNHPLVGHAYHFANASHEGQDRDAGQPYITHPIGVALILASELGFARDAEMMAAALLHDAVEDSALTLNDIEPTFGENIATLVSGVTKVEGSKAGRATRRIATLQHLFTHAGRDPRVLILKLADRMYNMRSLDGIAELGRRQRIARETIDIYAPLSHLLGMARVRRELEDRSLFCLEPRIANQIQTIFRTEPTEHLVNIPKHNSQLAQCQRRTDKCARAREKFEQHLPQNATSPPQSNSGSLRNRSHCLAPSIVLFGFGNFARAIPARNGAFQRLYCPAQTQWLPGSTYQCPPQGSTLRTPHSNSLQCIAWANLALPHCAEMQSTKSAAPAGCTILSIGTTALTPPIT